MGCAPVRVSALAGVGDGRRDAGRLRWPDERGANIISAMPDFRGPTISAFAIGKSTGWATGFIKPSATYCIYANVTDVGTPPSGTATVIANVATVTAGQMAVPLDGRHLHRGRRDVQLPQRAAHRRRPRTVPGHLDRDATDVGGQRDEPERQRHDRQRRRRRRAASRRAAASRVVPRSGTCSPSRRTTRSTPSRSCQPGLARPPPCRSASCNRAVATASRSGTPPARRSSRSG